jgi:chromatin remodeling complex protein RSC6
MKSARKPNADFLKPVQPDEVLAAIVGIESLLPNDLNKKLCNSAKKKKLQDAKVSHRINADDTLNPAFDGKNAISLFEFSKLVSGHLEAKRVAWDHF